MNTLTYTSRKESQRDGFTLVEVMMSVAIIIIVALGTLSFQYYNVKDSRTSEAQTTATRLAQLLLEDWKSTGGDPLYDATTLGLGFLAPTPPTAGNYIITLDNQTFYLSMAQQLAPVGSGTNPDNVAGVTLQQLSVTVSWRKDYGNGAVSGSDPTLTFTTFVRRDS
ncbi:MAG: prepilin-type N-terminal cleavage/methylation domain-containing protein [Sedimentisphaerales bacterium]|jgi:prepilin-type N-terminal cleavage/methylation domain-containing protein